MPRRFGSAGGRARRRASLAWILGRAASGMALCGLLAALAVPAISETDAKDGKQGSHVARRITANYRGLLDVAVIAHSGRTVGDLLAGDGKQAPGSSAGELQPYCEPFSFLLNDLVTADRLNDDSPFVSAVAEYPPGVCQPAWAALFREGRYQLFVGERGARLFLKGKTPVRLLGQHLDVARHALAAAMDKLGCERLPVEVFAFENDYARQALELDLQPHVESVTRADLRPERTLVPLDGLAALLSRGGAPEAAEIDGDGALFLYTQSAGDTTIGGAPQALSDLAVIYRGIFHSAHNPPYVSLDKHEDNRLAKVNFGGLLADTRVGSVVLEADKLFKALATGLDPNSRQSVVDRVERLVPGFMTQDQRSLLGPGFGGSSPESVRYWFYPERIRTVTDGRIAAVDEFHFLADAERMEAEKKPLGAAQRATIDHLNDHFDSYARAFQPFRELTTVGRLMSLVAWLREADHRAKADLAGLLAVELPAVRTPRATNKLLAASAIGEVHARDLDQRSPLRVILLEHLMGGMSASARDDELLDRARAFMKDRDNTDLIPPSVLRARADLEAMERDLGKKKAATAALLADIERARPTVDATDRAAVDRFNALVGRYDADRRACNEDVARFNERSAAVALQKVQTRSVVSVGGGVNLEPERFGKPVRQPSSARLDAVREARDPRPGTRSGLIRSSGKPAEGAIAPKAPPVRLAWQKRASVAGRTEWTFGVNGRAAIEKLLAPQAQQASYLCQLQTETYFTETTIKAGDRTLTVLSSQYPAEILATGQVAEGRTITLRRGREIEPRKDRHLWPVR